MSWLAQYWRHVPTPLRQVAVLVVGIVLVLAGLAMLVLPGPGLITILLGLVVLATEFAWAHHLLGKGLAKVPARWRPALERTITRPRSTDS
jgi:uncharacterized protein (TIGR02611 family)